MANLAIFSHSRARLTLRALKQAAPCPKSRTRALPGSLDPRPVFPVETIRPIGNALIKARTAAVQARQQQQSRAQHDLLILALHPIGTSQNPLPIRGDGRNFSCAARWSQLGRDPQGRNGSCEGRGSEAQGEGRKRRTHRKNSRRCR